MIAADGVVAANGRGGEDNGGASIGGGGVGLHACIQFSGPLSLYGQKCDFSTTPRLLMQSKKRGELVVLPSSPTDRRMMLLNMDETTKNQIVEIAPHARLHGGYCMLNIALLLYFPSGSYRIHLVKMYHLGDI